MKIPGLAPGVVALIERTFQALDSYREDLVLVGGLVPFIYLQHPEASRPALAPLATNDVDLAIPRQLAPRNARTVRMLLDESGFHTREIPGLYDTVGQYTFSLEAPARGQAHYIEFLTPLRGPEPRRPQRTQADLPLWPLRYIDLLQAAPIQIDHDQLGSVRVPHPLTYIIQKALIRDGRKIEERRVRDQAAILWTLLAFEAPRSGWARLREELANSRHEWGVWITRGLKELGALYENEEWGPREVSAAFAGAISPAVVEQTVQGFIEEMNAKGS